MRIRIPVFVASIVFLFGSAVALAQESTGAGRMELSAAPGGGVVFTKPAKTTDIDFSNYALGGGFTYNWNRFFGVEGEVGGGLGLRHSFNSIAVESVMDEDGNITTAEHTVVTKALTPKTLAYEGNAVYHPRGNNHAIVPYVTGGLGGLTMFTRTELEPLGLVKNEHFFTGNAGGGLKWFVAPG